MTVWLLWTVSDETLADLLLGIYHAEHEALGGAAAERAGAPFGEYWVNEWVVK